MLQTSATELTKRAFRSVDAPQVVALRQGRRRSFTGLFRRRQQTATRQPAHDAAARWILSAPSVGQNSYTEFVVSGGEVSALRPEVLRTLVRLGPFPFSLRLRSPCDGSAAVELRIGGLDQAAADRIAKSLTKAAGVRRVRYRGSAFGGEICAPRPEAVRQSTKISLAESA